MKRRRNKGFWLCSLRAYAVAVIVGCCLLAACTEADTVDSVAGMREGYARFGYSWTKDAPQPDSMTVVALRAVNYWKSGLQVATQNGAGDRYLLPRGSYRFYTLTSDATHEVTARRLTNYLQAPSDGFQLSEVYMEYASHKLKDPALAAPKTGWHDENTGFGFVRGDVLPVYFDDQGVVEIDPKADQTVGFTPHEVTQVIALGVTIQKLLGTTPFVVDSVWAEVSGVPDGVTVADGYIVQNPIRKALFRMQLTDGSGKEKADTKTATQVQARYRLHVPALIASNPTDTRGPGIMQVAVYISYEETVGGTKVKRARKLQASGNISELINKKAPLKLAADQEHYVKNAALVALQVPVPITMSTTAITDNSQWTQTYIVYI